MPVTLNLADEDVGDLRNGNRRQDCLRHSSFTGSALLHSKFRMAISDVFRIESRTLG